MDISMRKSRKYYKYIDFYLAIVLKCRKLFIFKLKKLEAFNLIL